MKVIHLALSAGGGAGIAASRSVRALRERGVKAELWTADGGELGPALRSRHGTLLRVLLDGAPGRFYRRKTMFSAWSNNWQPSRLALKVNVAKPDIVNLHWVGSGFMSLRELPRFCAPIVWTMHDAWPLTGGCHYPDRCQEYTATCGKCPQLGSRARRDLSWLNLRAKRELLDHIAAFVTPSAWLASLAATSGAVAPSRLHVIPYGLDGKVFSRGDRVGLRAAFSLADDTLVFVAGAQHLAEPRKGCHLLRETMRRVTSRVSRHCVLMLIGAGGDSSEGDWPCDVRWLGTLRNEADIVGVLSAADVLLLPSLQDNFPNMALEAQACGCPVVGFDTGGLREIIDPMLTGMLAHEISSEGLANAVVAWLASEPNRQEVASRARTRFEREFSFQLHGRRMVELYINLRAQAAHE